MKKLDPRLFDFQTNLVNLSSSLLRHFGVTPFHPTIPEVDALLEKHPKVALFLFDGAGEAVLNAHKRQAKAFLEHRFLTIQSVNPPTTTAATTSLLTGKYPIETGWLGWCLQDDELGFPIDCFPNVNSLTGERIEGHNRMRIKCPVVQLDRLINEQGTLGKKAHLLFSSNIDPKNGIAKAKDIAKKASHYFQEEDVDFLYVYWPMPDGIIHRKGVNHRSVGACLKTLSKQVLVFKKENPDVLAMVIADHGLVDVAMRDIAAFPELQSLQRKAMSIEGRCATFFIEEGKQEEFRLLFEKHFPNFVLMDREEVLSSHYFGEGEAHPRVDEFLGDFLAVAVGEDLLIDSKVDHDLVFYRAHHAGGLPAEKDICLSIF